MQRTRVYAGISRRFTNSHSLPFPSNISHFPWHSHSSSRATLSSHFRKIPRGKWECRICIPDAGLYLPRRHCTQLSTCSVDAITLHYLVVPRVRSTRSGSRSFRVCGPTIWNKLPQDLRSTDTREQFKRSLKRWLFECAYGRRRV